MAIFFERPRSIRAAIVAQSVREPARSHLPGIAIEMLLPMAEPPATVTLDELSPVGSVSIRRGLAGAVIFAAGALFILREAAAFAAPILGAVLLAYALEPFVAAFMRSRLPRPAAVIVTYAVVA